MPVTADRVRELFDYNEFSGLFVRKVRTAMRNKVGDIVGCKDTYGYLQVAVDGRLYLLHRLAWLYVYGSFPEGTIDHIDRCKTNNSIANLRDVSRLSNMKNLPLFKNNTTGFSGVCFRKSSRRYFAHISHKSKKVHLGSYLTAEAADSAYQLAKYFIEKYDYI